MRPSSVLSLITLLVTVSSAPLSLKKRTGLDDTLGEVGYIATNTGPKSITIAPAIASNNGQTNDGSANANAGNGGTGGEGGQGGSGGEGGSSGSNTNTNNGGTQPSSSTPPPSSGGSKPQSGSGSTPPPSSGGSPPSSSSGEVTQTNGDTGSGGDGGQGGNANGGSANGGDNNQGGTAYNGGNTNQCNGIVVGECGNTGESVLPNITPDMEPVPGVNLGL